MNFLAGVLAGFRKGRETKNQNANILWITEKNKRVPEKTSISALLTMPKHLTVWITQTGNFFKKWEYQTT